MILALGNVKLTIGGGVRDNCYCWAATPLDYDEAKRREEIEKGK